MASKWMSTAEAVRTYIKDGDQIALGGFTVNRNPMSISSARPAAEPTERELDVLRTQVDPQRLILGSLPQDLL